MKQDMIVILDLGSTENTVLARAIRALGVYSEIYPHDITAAELTALPNVKGVIINGGPNHVIDGVDIDVLPEIYKAGIPVMAAGHDKACCEVKLPQPVSYTHLKTFGLYVVKNHLTVFHIATYLIPTLLSLTASGFRIINNPPSVWFYSHNI